MEKFFLQASRFPDNDLAQITYAGQDPRLRLYRKGYETFMNQMPVLSDNDPMLSAKLELTKKVMSRLADQLIEDGWVVEDASTRPEPNGFTRTIIALEPPLVTEAGTLQEGAELVVAQWGTGFTSPVHGHTAGYLHEQILNGKVLVNTYRMITPDSPLVRPVETVIAERGVFADLYTRAVPNATFKRQTLIHSFTALEPTASLHYLSEHTRDGRDNKFFVQYFDEAYPLTTDDVTPITSQDGLYLRTGDVALVRSENVPDYGDHYILITGHPVNKPHGLRPQDVAIAAPTATAKMILDSFQPRMGLRLLKLKPSAAAAWRQFHGVQRDEDGKVYLPKA